MQCDLCHRHEEPEELGWLTLIGGRIAGCDVKTYTYCPTCVARALLDLTESAEAEE